MAYDYDTGCFSSRRAAEAAKIPAAAEIKVMRIESSDPAQGALPWSGVEGDDTDTEHPTTLPSARNPALRHQRRSSTESYMLFSLVRKRELPPGAVQ